MALIISLVIASLGLIVYSFLLVTAGKEILGSILICKREQCIEKIKTAQIDLNLLVEKMKKTKDVKDKASIKKGKELKKIMEDNQKEYARLEKGKLGLFDMLPAAGYRFIQLVGWDSTSPVIKKLNQKCVQFKEKREAMNYTYYLLGSLISYCLLSVVVGFTVMSLFMVKGTLIRSAIFGIAVMIIIAIIGYIPFDNVNQVITKRAEEIESEFPQVVSKLTLLTVAGMEVSRAWELASKSGTGTLYNEMNKVLVDFDNNVSPTEAYSKFITRCNNSYTTKLATAIIQNTSKGNSEIVTLFKRLNDESWLEYKHSARKIGEKVSSKLMVPTMLLFAGIIILIIIPVCTGFNFM